jgi:hypothetical protein
MNKKLFTALILGLSTSSLTMASFDDVYNSLMNKLQSISSPAIVTDVVKNGDMLGSDTTMTVHINSNNQDLDVNGKLTLKSKGIMSTTWSLAASGNLSLVASGNIDDKYGKVALDTDYLINTNNVFFHMNTLELPLEDEPELALMTSLFKNKWLKIPVSWSQLEDLNMQSVLQVSALTNQHILSEMLMKEQIISQIPNQVWIKRNGYEIYPIMLNPIAIKNIAASLNPELSAQSDKDVLDEYNKAMKSYGIIWKKWNEIKMAMIMKTKKNITNRTKILTTYSSSWESQHTFWMLVKEKNNKMWVSATIDNSKKETSKLYMTLELEEFSVNADISTLYYNAGKQIIEEPKDAINLENMLEDLPLE